MSAGFRLKNKSEWIYHELSNYEAFIQCFELSDSQKLLLKEVDFSLIPSTVNLVEFQGVFGILHSSYQEILPVSVGLVPASQEIQKKGDPLYKLLKQSKSKSIIDATGGLLGDSLRMLSLGFKVRAYEQNPILQVLIILSIEDENFEFIPQKFEWKEVEKIGDPVLYDPFFRKKNQSALPQGKLQILKEFDSGDEYLEYPSHLDNEFKVWVKRPQKAPDIWEGKHGSIKSKTIRYDLYYSKKRSDP